MPAHVAGTRPYFVGNGVWVILMVYVEILISALLCILTLNQLRHTSQYGRIYCYMSLILNHYKYLIYHHIDIYPSSQFRHVAKLYYLMLLVGK